MTSSPENSKNLAHIVIVLTLIFSMSYAVTRYQIFGPVPWKELPLFILNKGISLSAFILLTLNFSLSPLNNLGIKVSENWLNSRKAIGISSFFLLAIHVLISFLLFQPAIYGKFFETNGTLTLFANLSMLGGVLAFAALWIYYLSFQSPVNEDNDRASFITSRKFLLLVMLLGGTHLFFMGYEGWLNPSSWYGKMPPISLVAFIFLVVGSIINFFGRK